MFYYILFKKDNVLSMIFMKLSRFFKIIHVLLKILNDFLLYVFYSSSIHVSSMILIIFSRFFRIFQDFTCSFKILNDILLHLKRNIHVLFKWFWWIFQDFSRFFKIFQDFSWFFMIFFLYFIFVHHFTMIKSCISPLLPYYTIFKSVNISNKNNKNNNNKFVTCWTTYMRKRSKRSTFFEWTTINNHSRSWINQKNPEKSLKNHQNLWKNWCFLNKLLHIRNHSR